MEWRAGLEPETEQYARVPGLAGRLARGAAAPEQGWDWIERPNGEAGGIALVRIAQAVVFPRLGLIVDRAGVPLFASAGQVPPRARLRGTCMQSGRCHVPEPNGVPVLPRASCFMAGGALRNYGHFLCDALPGRLALHHAGMDLRYPALAPPLPGWAQDLLEMARLPVRMARARAVRIEDLVLVTSMNAYLNRAGPMLRAVADRLTRAGNRTPPQIQRRGTDPTNTIYLSRRGYSGRILLEEAALEQALRARGVHVLRPERMSVRAQREAMAQCHQLIGASGAALANALFLPPEAQVIELRPPQVREPWMQLMCAALGMGHRVVQGTGPVPREDLPLHACLRQVPRWIAGRYHYAWRIDLDAALAGVSPIQRP